jgi:hypothetical protein
MSNADRMSLAEGAHLAGMALLLAFAAAFILSSARAAKPAEGQDLPDIITALTVPVAAGTIAWRELGTRLRVKWSEAPPGAWPPGLETSSTVRLAQVPARVPVEGSRQRPDNWQITAWGSVQSASAVRVSRDGPGADLEQALRASGVPFTIECETDLVRHYRLHGRRGGYAAQYAVGGGQQEILFFPVAPPEALLRRDGCLISSVHN